MRMCRRKCDMMSVRQETHCGERHFACTADATSSHGKRASGDNARHRKRGSTRLEAPYAPFLAAFFFGLGSPDAARFKPLASFVGSEADLLNFRASIAFLKLSRFFLRADA